MTPNLTNYHLLSDEERMAFAENHPRPEPRPDGVLKGGSVPSFPCVDPDDQLTHREIDRINEGLVASGQKPLSKRRRWFRCRTVHGQHPCCGK